MAGDWIKMTVHLDTDPSVIQMASALSQDEFTVVGRLWKIWCWADQHSVSGNAMNVTQSFLDRISNCSGFAAAMRDAGWLEGRDNALTFPHFNRHNGQTAKTRALTKDRVRENRNDKNVTEALPEKRREEKSLKGDTSVSPKAKPLRSLPDDEYLDSLAKSEAYRGIDVRRQYAQMIEWCKLKGKQPSRTRLVNWLNRAERPMTVGAQPNFKFSATTEEQHQKTKDNF